MKKETLERSERRAGGLIRTENKGTHEKQSLIDPMYSKSPFQQRHGLE